MNTSEPVHINIVGRKKSGKTTLIQALIPELTRNNMNVGTVKHTSHNHEFDIENTDSWKHRQAGSQATVILSPGRIVCHCRKPGEDKTLSLLKIIFQDKDLVLWEGDDNTANEMIECVGTGNESLYRGDDRLIAIVSDDIETDDVRVFKFSEVRTLAQWLMERYRLVEPV